MNLNDGKIEIIPVSSVSLESCLVFLNRHEDSTQFLLGNLREHGSQISGHHNSGNFKLLRTNGTVRGVFCLTKRGNLLAQIEMDCADTVLEDLKSEPIELKGFIGDWRTIEPIVTRYRELNPRYRPIYESKEILYSYALTQDDRSLQADARVRFLEDRDFAQWLELNQDYLAELSLPDELTHDEKRLDFDRRTKQKIWWGLFDGETLQSMAALNSQGDSVGQVGGVYTPPEHRKKGLARAVVTQLLKDCRDLYRHRKSILFTGEIDFAARKLYESIGYRNIGEFALILS